MSPKSSRKSSPKPATRPAKLASAARVDEMDQLLYSREQTCRLLGGIHKSTIVRYEEAGRLRPVRLNPGKATAKVFYRRAEVLALAEG